MVLQGGALPMLDRYTNPLSLTSQMFFCGLPLRLDSYRGCGFQCAFCYARYRGGNSPEANISPADPETLRRILEHAFRATTAEDAGILGQFLRRKVPIHFGGMSDPFHQAEHRFGVTKRFLETLLEFDYPTVISTRSTLPAAEPYLSLISRMRAVIVQFSMTSTDNAVSRRLEPNCPGPTQLMKAMERLAHRGVHVTSRWQPYVPGVSEPPGRFIGRIASAGVKHVALEHLKLPVERNHPLWPKLREGVGRDIQLDYESVGAHRDGREYVLPSKVKLPTILEFREAARDAGLSYGIADNEFQYLSNSDCCCSGVDRFSGFEGWFKHQIAHAVRRCRGREIVYGSIAGYWTPVGSVDRWLNSQTRIGGRAGNGGTLGDHIRLRWNDPRSPLSPAAFYGVTATERFSSSGFRIYDWNTEAERA